MRQRLLVSLIASILMALPVALMAGTSLLSGWFISLGCNLLADGVDGLRGRW